METVNKDAPPIKSANAIIEKERIRLRTLARLEDVSIALFYILFFVIWEFYGRTLSSLVFSYPSAIVEAAIEMVRNGELSVALVESTTVLLKGLFLSLIIGILVGFALGRFAIIRRIFGPIVNLFYIAPRVIFIPLLVVWFGLSQTSKVVLIVLAAVFPVIFNVTDGVRSVSAQYVEVARSYGANEWQVTREVTIPAILPFIGAGVKNAIGRGLTGLIVAEFFIGASGIGGLLQKVSAAYRIDKSFVIILILVIMGFVLTKIGEYVESYFGRWRETERAF